MWMPPAVAIFSSELILGGGTFDGQQPVHADGVQIGREAFLHLRAHQLQPSKLVQVAHVPMCADDGRVGVLPAGGGPDQGKTRRN